jgi:hypothetical protein
MDRHLYHLYHLYRPRRFRAAAARPVAAIARQAQAQALAADIRAKAVSTFAPTAAMSAAESSSRAT